MRKFAVIIVIALTLMLLNQSISAAYPVNSLARYTQITTDSHYDRDSNLLKANDATYWLFFARGRDARGIRDLDGYTPDLDYYDIYYKTSLTINGLASAAENMIPLTPPDNAQRDISVVQTNDGVIWVFTSTGLGSGTERSVFYYTYDGTWHGPFMVPDTDYAAHISVVDYGGKIWIFFDIGYTLSVTSYDEILMDWSDVTSIENDATLAKAIVSEGVFYVAWTKVNGIDIWGSGIYLSSSSDGLIWTSTENPIAYWDEEGATNWDPAIIETNGQIKLIWAPDVGAGGQFLAMSTSATPMTPGSWSAPVMITVSSNAGNSWWDFWPEPYKDQEEFLLFTSERDPLGLTRIDGNIWLLQEPLEIYLPFVIN